jgi:hypothetical protein
MNKGQIIGLVVTGLAVVGGVAVYNYFRKPKETRGKFLNASGVEPRQGSTVSGTQCKDSNGDYYVQTGGRPCRGNDKPIRMIVKGQFGGKVG